MGVDFLQIFLLANVFLVGVILTIAVQHARAHFRPKPKTKDTVNSDGDQKTAVGLTPAERQRLLQIASVDFAKVLQRSSDELEHSLAATINELGAKLGRLGADMIADELQHYQQGVENVRQQTLTKMSQSDEDISKQQTDIKQLMLDQQTKFEQAMLQANNEFEAKVTQRRARLEADLVALESGLTQYQSQLQNDLESERTKLETALKASITTKQAELEKQLDTKLGSAVNSFLAETLGHNVDLGTQSTYLLAQLEEHKDELKREVQGEV